MSAALERADVSEELLAEITRRLVVELQPETIILFGSRAWGMPRQDSDIDLLVVLPDDEPRRAAQLRARRCLADIVVPKDLVLRTRAQMDRYGPVPSSLEALILRQGRVLYAGPEG